MTPDDYRAAAKMLLQQAATAPTKNLRVMYESMASAQLANLMRKPL